MENRPGLVHEPEKARPCLRPALTDAQHRNALNSGQDVPAQRPRHGIPLTAVGICEKKVWINLPQGRIGFDAEISVSLPPDLRGIHMSRIEEAVSDLYPREFKDIRHYALALARKVLDNQEGDSCLVKISGSIPHLWKSCCSRKISVDTMVVHADAEVTLSGNGISHRCHAGITVNHMTACPCTQIYNTIIFGKNGCMAPAATHSQRSATTITIQDRDSVITFDDLFACLADCLHLTQDLLKRPDEAEIVLKSHNEPQFAEDVVRDAAVSCYSMFNRILPPESTIHIESVSLESIHTHNVMCRLETSIGELKKIMDKMAY